MEIDRFTIISHLIFDVLVNGFFFRCQSLSDFFGILLKQSYKRIYTFDPIVDLVRMSGFKYIKN